MTIKKFWRRHHKKEREMKGHMHGSCGSIYFLGFIGAAFYYVQQSATFWQGVVGVFKALFWPAFLVYKLIG